MNQGLKACVFGAVCALGCGGTAERESSEFIDEPASAGDIGTLEQRLIAEGNIVCADANQTVYFAYARIRGSEVGSRVSNGCAPPLHGCVTHYHICGSGGCSIEYYPPFDDAICRNL